MLTLGEFCNLLEKVDDNVLYDPKLREDYEKRMKYEWRELFE